MREGGKRTVKERATQDKNQKESFGTNKNISNAELDRHFIKPPLKVYKILRIDRLSYGVACYFQCDF